MAAIDKTYVNKEQLLEAIEWAKEVDKATLENGSMFYPLDFIYGYNDIDDPTFWEKEIKTYEIIEICNLAEHRKGFQAYGNYEKNIASQKIP